MQNSAAHFLSKILEEKDLDERFRKLLEENELIVSLKLNSNFNVQLEDKQAYQF